MIYDGFCESRSRHKWRYPLACGKIDEYTHKNQFSPSKYGRVIYTKPDWDLRLFNINLINNLILFFSIIKLTLFDEDYNMMHVLSVLYF